MRKTITSIFVIIFIAMNLLFAEKVIIRIENADRKTYDYFLSNNYDIASFIPDKYLDIVIIEENLTAISDLGYRFKNIKTESQMKENLVLKSKDIYGYRSYDDMITELEDLVDEHPNILQLIDIGDTRGKEYYEGGNNNYIDYQHEVWCVKLSDNVEINEDEPNICFDGEHHAREPISMEMVMLILNYLVDNYATGSDATFWINNSQIWFVPLLNPNGHKIVIEEIDVWWRKNIRDNDENGYITWGGYDYPDGVDPNRNYGPEKWWGGAGTSGSTGELYCGPYPFSEPETSALRDLLLNYKFVAGMSYHSYSELILWPLGFNMSCIAPDVDALSDLGIEMAATVPSQYGGYYTPQQTNALYPCSGTTCDYGYGIHRIFYYITELATEYIPPAATMEDIIEDNLSAALILLNRVFYSTITGIVTDSLSGEPIIANVKVPSIDNYGTSVEPCNSGENFGRYYRILLPGAYDLEFSKFGYVTRYFEDVEVIETEQTILDVALNIAPTVTVNITIENEDGIPIPGAIITILNTPLEPITTGLNGQATIPGVPLGEYLASIYESSYGTFIYPMVVTENCYNFTFVMVEPFIIDSFEDGLNNWTAQYPWDITSEQSYSGDYSVTDSPGGNYSNLITTNLTSNESVDLSNAISAHIEFATRYEIEQGYDYAYFQISTDGFSWNTLESFTGTQDFWSIENYDLIDYCGEIVTFRFRFYSDTYVTEDGIYIDDFKVYKCEDYTSTDDIPDLVSKFQLYQNHPNPFSTLTTISFLVIPKNTENTEILIYNVKGQLVKNLAISNPKSKINKVVWDGRDEKGNQLSSGIYFYKLSNQDKTFIKKMILLR